VGTWHIALMHITFNKELSLGMPRVKLIDKDQRKQESSKIRGKFPDRIPVICEKAEKTDIPVINKTKYLVPAVCYYTLTRKDLTVGQFVYVVRRRVKLAPEKAIFIFVGDILPSTAATMNAIYDEHKDEDGFLYMRFVTLDGIDDKLRRREYLVRIYTILTGSGP